MRLRAGVRLVRDRVSGRHVLVGPERGLILDPTAHAIVALIAEKPAATVDDIVDALDARAPRDVVLRDVTAFVHALAERRLIDL